MFLLVFGGVTVPYFGHFNMYVVVFHCVFIFISQVTYDVEHLFIWLFAICISSLVICVQIFCPFLIGLSVVLLNFKSSSDILDTSPLPDKCSAKILFPACAHLFILLPLSFVEWEFHFNAATLTILLLVVYLKICQLTHGHFYFLLYFLDFNCHILHLDL